MEVNTVYPEFHHTNCKNNAEAVQDIYNGSYTMNNNQISMNDEDTLWRWWMQTMEEY